MLEARKIQSGFYPQKVDSHPKIQKGTHLDLHKLLRVVVLIPHPYADFRAATHLENLLDQIPLKINLSS